MKIFAPFACVLLSALLLGPAKGQNPAPAPAPQQTAEPAPPATDAPQTDEAHRIAPGTPDPGIKEERDKRILGVLPNYRTAEQSEASTPLTAHQKLRIAAKDSFDWPSYITAAGLSGLGQLENSNPSFGQGMVGYSKRYGTGVGDQIIGNMLTEGFLPVLLHEDPRYFRKASGGTWSRAVYAATRVVVTRTDAGTNRFNFSEIGGNSISALIGVSYYPDQRDVSDTIQRASMQIAIDAFSNVLKEFWPDIKRKYFHKHQASY